ncbi:ASKHA domain-containing protein [Thermincola potens]|uniref:Ferredoxin n=1 Tax=Thermincola potens (strain JR) TaxID=635013 RepID=D5XAK1_THEPJ|nr:ASKHA domain-containing protein [Thermincola potens]ADG81300.1 ferredoxin [Thermincola potens JR]
MQTILDYGQRNKVELNPLAQRYTVKIKMPGLTDNQGDVDRLRRYLPESLKGVHIPLEVMRELPSVFLEGDWQVSVIVAQAKENPWVIDIEPEVGKGNYYGLALDIGTTTTVLYLVDLASGEVLGNVSSYNGQVKYGDDILTRIYLGSTENGREKLRQAVLETINGQIQQLVSEHNVEQNKIYAMVVAGNTTMIHLFLGLDPANICREPYIPVVNSPGILKAIEVGVAINPLAPLYCLPNVGSYVGGDVIAGLLVSGMHQKPELSLLVDIGTNGEMVLGNNEWLVTCAGAAGPALEGGAAEHGMRAEAGAIYKVSIDPATLQTDYRVIGSVKPRGICGSGLIDCMAQMLVAGIIDRSGRFNDDSGAFVIAGAQETATGQDIVVSQKDIRSLLKTKAAVTAAVEVLMEGVGCSFKELEKFYAAGAFGAYIDPESAITIGLYPDIPRQNIISLGNSSLEGARLALLSREKIDEAETLAKSITYFELNNNREFMKKFTSGLFLPHMDLNRYPSVKKKLQNVSFV